MAGTDLTQTTGKRNEMCIKLGSGSIRSVEPCWLRVTVGSG
jgi:hypothetical protein